MDGKTLLTSLAARLDERFTTSSFLDTRISYDYLWEAACELVRRTQCLTATQSITTVAEQSTYDLNADFMALYLTNSDNKYIVKYSDGTSNNWPTLRDYYAVIRSDNTTSTTIPSNFSLIDKQSLTSAISGTVTSAGASTDGECTLTDSAAPFTYVEAGDSVHNTTDGSDGVVISVTDTSNLVTTLFGGTDNDWDSSDAYIVVPGGRKQIVFDPPPSTSDHTVTVYYIPRPEPVYSYYRTYRFDPHFKEAMVMYAAWLYKYRDSDPNFGDAYYKFFDQECRKANRTTSQALNRNSFKVNLKRQSFRDRSYR